MFACAAFVAGCDLGAPSPTSPTRGLDTPPLRLVSAWVTTGYDTTGAPIRTPLARGTVVDGVRQSTTIVLRFDRFLLPANVIRQAICVRPSTDPVGQLTDCGSPGQPFLEPVYSPARRQVVFHQRPGERLLSDTLYRLTVYPPLESADYGFRAFDGTPLDEHYQLDFRTASDAVANVEEPLPSPSRYCAAIACVDECRRAPDRRDDPEAQQECIDERCDCLDTACFSDGELLDPQTGVFAASCAFGGCHAGGSPVTAVPWGQGDAAMGLDLSTAAAVQATAIGRAAHQTQTGERAALPETSPARFGRSMPIVAPADPGNSYLLYKLIAQPLNQSRADGPIDADHAAALSRLRSWVVIGQPMPPDDGLLSSAVDPSGGESWERLLLFESWIAHGAVTTCP